MIPAVILAGGQGLRLGGGDKILRQVGGRTVLAWITSRLMPQCGPVAINANGDPARLPGMAVFPDSLPGQLGPLAGVLAAMEWARMQGADLVLTVPGDAPFVPPDLVARLQDARPPGEAGLACAASGGRDHPLTALWPVALAEPLRRALLDEDLRRVGAFTHRFPRAAAPWPTTPFDPFLNINTPADLAEAERYSSIA